MKKVWRDGLGWLNHAETWLFHAVSSHFAGHVDRGVQKDGLNGFIARLLDLPVLVRAQRVCGAANQDRIRSSAAEPPQARRSFFH